VIPSIADVAAAAWDACANPDDGATVEARGGPVAACGSPAGTFAQAYNPFISHAFLKALEASGSATARPGWPPQHLLLETAPGEVVGALPCYLKSHSRGEYVFDRGWAEAYERAGGCYYPKLQVSVPFTPATGPRLLVRP